MQGAHSPTSDPTELFTNRKKGSKHRVGNSNIAYFVLQMNCNRSQTGGFFSVTFSADDVHEQMKFTKSYIHFIICHIAPHTITRSKIRHQANNDNILKGVHAAIQLEKWDSDIVKPSKQIDIPDFQKSK